MRDRTQVEDETHKINTNGEDVRFRKDVILRVFANKVSDSSERDERERQREPEDQTAKRNNKFDFPTPLSPISSSLKR